MSALSDLLSTTKAPRQDFVYIAGKKSPGLACPMGTNSPRKWDERTGYGFSGAYLVYLGDGLSKFNIDFFIWDDADWGPWADFASVLQRAPQGTRAKANGIAHPLLTMPPLSITSVVVEDYTGWVQDEFGLWMSQGHFKEFRAPLPMLGRPLAAIPAVAAAVPTAQDAGDVEIQRLRAQRDGLAAP